MDDEPTEQEALAAILHLYVSTGELKSGLAREIFAAVYGYMDTEREFGPDPEIERAIRGHRGILAP